VFFTRKKNSWFAAVEFNSAWIFTCGFVFRPRGECYHMEYVLGDNNVNPVLPLASVL
jgi:hypothetical protein